MRLVADTDLFDSGEYDKCVEFLDTNLVKFPKKQGWWLPAHNLGVNMTLLGEINLWVFTVLPMFPAKRAYLPAGTDPQKEPEGIVLEPNWTVHPKYRDTAPATLKIAEHLLELAKAHPMVAVTADKEFDWVERTFHIKVPPAIAAKYKQEAPKIAFRRWGINRMTVRPTFTPFDGRKPMPMTAFGRPWYA